MAGCRRISTAAQSGGGGGGGGGSVGEPFLPTEFPTGLGRAVLMPYSCTEYCTEFLKISTSDRTHARERTLFLYCKSVSSFITDATDAKQRPPHRPILKHVHVTCTNTCSTYMIV